MSEEYKDGDQALPQYDVESFGTMSGFWDTMFALHDIKTECAIPAQVVSYDRNTHLATVKPIVKFSIDTKDGRKYADRPEYKEIPVLQSHHGGFLIDFPLTEGDTGVLLAVDRAWKAARAANMDADLAKNKGSVPADDDTLASFEHGVFIPDSWQLLPLNDEYKDALLIKEIDAYGRSYGDVILERNGETHIRATRHEEIIDGITKLIGGTVTFHTDYQYTDILTQQLVWALGDVSMIANLGVQGNVIASKWEDPDGKTHGGSIISTNGERTATMSADDLDKTDAKFRDITIVVGMEEGDDGKNYLITKKVRVLIDEPEDGEKIEVAGGGELYSINLNGSRSTNKFYGTGEIALNIAQKILVAGANISISSSGNYITISSSGGGGGGGTSGYTGSRNILADVDYTYPYLRKRFIQETWENGVLKTQELLDWQNYHEAVEETV